VEKVHEREAHLILFSLASGYDPIMLGTLDYLQSHCRPKAAEGEGRRKGPVARPRKSNA
jgi:hypothetical protein